MAYKFLINLLKIILQHFKKKFESNGEICEICDKRVKRNEHSVMIHWSKGDGMYVHPEHIIESKQYKDFVNSVWHKKITKALKEKGSYTISHQDEAMMGGSIICSSKSIKKKNNSEDGFIAGLFLGTMLDE